MQQKLTNKPLRSVASMAAAAALLLAPTASLAQQNVFYDSEAYMNGDFGAAPVQNFTSRPDLTPPAINIRTNDATWDDNQYVFMPYRYTDGRSGNYILDGNGSLVWGSDEFPSMDFKVQTYQNEPVLTYFRGSFYSLGYGQGDYDVVNATYDVVRTVTFQTEQGDNLSDFHEMVITANNTFLVAAWFPVQADLSSKGGAEDGWTFDCHFQELDEDNNVLFNWTSLEHGVTIDESYFGMSYGAGDNSSDPYDYCHLNSLEKDDEGHFLVSMRGPSTVYKIDGQTGDIIWRLGGKNSDFDIADEDRFYYQHDARWLNASDVNPRYMSIFDNNGAEGGYAILPAEARGMVWAIDQEAMTAELVYEMPATSTTYSNSQGNVQQLDDGYMIGWGSQHWFTEYDNAGNVVYDVSFAPNVTTGPQAYRVFKQHWSGMPNTTPDIGFANDQLFVSWNGATNVTSWGLATGNSPTDLSVGSHFARVGFESNSTFDATSAGVYIAAVALNGDGDCLGVSSLYYAGNTTSSNQTVACDQLSSSQIAAADSDDDSSSASALQTVVALTLAAVVASYATLV